MRMQKERVMDRWRKYFGDLLEEQGQQTTLKQYTTAKYRRYYNGIITSSKLAKAPQPDDLTGKMNKFNANKKLENY